jgi:ketosteroid isomerase-like protein
MTETTAREVTPTRAREAMARLLAAWEQGDLEGLDGVLAEDAVYKMPPFPDMSRDELRNFVPAFRTGFPALHVMVHEDLVTGATSAHRWTAEGVFSAATPLLPGVEPTGAPQTAEGIHVLHWSGDVVTEVWHFGDWLGWLTQAGVIPPLPEAAG